MSIHLSCGAHTIDGHTRAWWIMNRADQYFTDAERDAAWGRPCPPGDDYYGKIPLRAVKAMQEALPAEFYLLPVEDRDALDEDGFAQIRDFLADVVCEGLDISCSY